MPNHWIFSRAAAAALTALAAGVLVACSDAPSGPTGGPAGQRSPLMVSARRSAAAGGPMFLACPSSAPVAGSAVIGPEGGMLGVAGNALLVPPHAVPQPTRFTLTVPASPVVQLQIAAEGYTSYRFRHPVAVWVSYARCTDAELPASSLTAWWVEGSAGMMAAVDDRAARRVTFLTRPLSGYAVVY